MTKPDIPPLTLAPVEAPPPAKQAFDPWAAQTELSTRFVPRSDEQADSGNPLDRTIGKAVGGDTWELFASCAAADALALQFDIRPPVCMTLHDTGARTSLAYLGAVARQLGVPVRRLVIRRQGFGTVLATLRYAEAEATNGQSIRIYASDVEADEATRPLVQRMLLARSQVGVLLVGDQPDPWLEPTIEFLGQGVQGTGHGSLTLVSLAVTATADLDALSDRLALLPGLHARRAPRVTRLMEAWPFLVSTWNHLRPGVSPGSADAEAWLFKVAQDPRRASAAMPLGDVLGPLQQLVNGVAAFRRGVACCAFNARSLQVLAHAGAGTADTSLMARQGRMLLSSMQASSQVLGLGKAVSEGSVTLQDHLLVLRAVPGEPMLWVVAVLDDGPQVDLMALKAAFLRHEAAFAGRRPG